MMSVPLPFWKTSEMVDFFSPENPNKLTSWLEGNILRSQNFL